MSFFRLFANCIPVKGYNRSSIVDLQRDSIHLIPNDLFEILVKSNKTEISQIYLEFGDENQQTIEEYFTTLEDLELGFFCSEEELEYFPKMSLDFQTPFRVTNSIVEEIYDIDGFQNVIPQLENLGCEYLEIVLYKEIENNALVAILDLFFTSSIKYIGLVIKFDVTKDEIFVKALTSTKLRLSKIILHSSNEEKYLDVKDYNLTLVHFYNKELKNFNFCGVVNQRHFSVKMLHFAESISHNTCLNRKISIDKEGNIKNCPSMKESFGNIKDTTLEEALNHPNFKKYWNITKDQIAVCKDCEFRHICTDCRAYTENPDDQYSKPLKCGYNPYTNEWEEWSTNPLKQKAIEYYGMQELIKKDA